MLYLFRVDYCNEPSTNYLETNNNQLIGIDPDLHVYTDTVEKQCHNYDTSVDFKLKYCSQNSFSFVHSNICSTEKKTRRPHIILIIWTCLLHLLVYVRHGQHN